MGARGNSGVILSQILRGLADECRDARRRRRAPSCVTGFRHAADAAYEAVMRPVEGTILTVVRSIAEAVEALDATRRSSTLLETRRRRPRATRSRARPTSCRCCATPAWSTRAARASRCCSTRCSKWSTAARSPSPSSSTRPPTVAAHLAGDDDVSGLRYEVMYLLDAPDDTMPGFRDAWARSATRSSSSAATASGTATSTPTTSAPRSRPASTRAARTRSASPTSWSRSKKSAGCARPTCVADLDRVRRRRPPVTTAVVAVGVGDGIRRLLTSLGVQQVVAGGQSMNPSTAQILEAVEACARRLR